MPRKEATANFSCPLVYHRMVLHEAKSMGCSEIKALHNIPLKNMEMIVQALEEVQQYHAIGTLEELQTMKEHGGFTKPSEKAHGFNRGMKA